MSRLNRAHPKKHDVFVLDFMNDSDTIQEAFADYYRTTVLAEETDPDKLHDLKAALDGYSSTGHADGRVRRTYLGGADHDRLDPILDACVAVYKEQLDEDGRVDLRGGPSVPARLRLPLVDLALHQRRVGKLSIFLSFLV